MKKKENYVSLNHFKCVSMFVCAENIGDIDDNNEWNTTIVYCNNQRSSPNI